MNALTTITRSTAAATSPVIHSYTAAQSRALEDHFVAGYIREFGSLHPRSAKAPSSKEDKAEKANIAEQAEKRTGRILAFSARPITVLDVMEKFDCTMNQARRALRNLEKAGKIVRVDKGNGGKPVVYQAVKRSPNRNGAPAKPVKIGPVTFPSTVAASRALGFCDAHVSRALSRGGKKSMRNLIEAAERYHAAMQKGTGE